MSVLTEKSLVFNMVPATVTEVSSTIETTFTRSISIEMETVIELEYESYVTEVADSVNVNLLFWTRTDGSSVYLESELIETDVNAVVGDSVITVTYTDIQTGASSSIDYPMTIYPQWLYKYYVDSGQIVEDDPADSSDDDSEDDYEDSDYESSGGGKDNSDSSSSSDD